MPYIIFGGVALIAGLVTIKLPETKGKTIPDSLMRKLFIHRDCSCITNYIIKTEIISTQLLAAQRIESHPHRNNL